MLVSTLSTAFKSGPLIPRSGLALWLKSDVGITQSGGLVSQWDDQSGNGKHVTNSGSGRPTFAASVINGRPGITFTGAGTALINASNYLPQQNARHIITVQKVATGGVYTSGGTLISSGTSHSITVLLAVNVDTFVYMYTDGIGFSIRYVSTPTITDVPTVQSFAYSGAAGTVVASVNNVANTLLPSIASGSEDGSAGFYIGNRGDAGAGQYFSGTICEVIAYDHVLSAADLLVVNKYLQAKYAISLGV